MTETRLHGIEAKLVHAVGIAADEFGVIGDRGSLADRGWLEHADKHHSAFRQHMFEGDVLARELVPIEIGLFYKIDFVLIPAGDFHAKAYP